MKILWIAGFGAVGALLRYGLVLSLSHSWLPIATLAANWMGCLAIGFCFAWFVEPAGGAGASLVPWQLGLIVGLLGSLTTFSTLSLELWLLHANRTHLMGLTYLALTLIGGLLLVGGGLGLGRALR